MNTPPRTHKYLFWLNLGLISTFFAEVISGADLFPYFHLWGILIVVPIYLLHTLVLITLVYRQGRPTLPALYFAGTLFGLYEAYVTKMLWNPDWGEIFKIAELAVFEVFVLVFFWHVWMSFIFPLLAAETWLTGSSEILPHFPPRWQRLFGARKGWLWLAILGGLFVTINTSTPGHALLSGLGSALVLGCFGWLWRRLTRGRSYKLVDLLPNRREWIVLGCLLLGIYLLTGLTLRPEAFPPFLGHFMIWLVYGFCIFWLILALRFSRQSQPQGDSLFRSVSPRLWLWCIATFALTAAAAEALFLVLPLDGPTSMIGWFGVVLLGLLSLLWVMRLLLRERRALRKAAALPASMLLILLITLACGESGPIATLALLEKPAPNSAQVVLKGSHLMEIDITEGADRNYDQALQMARAAGSETVSLSLAWDDIETAPGVYRPDSNWLEIANLYCPSQGLPVSLVISTIDTGIDRHPPDLRLRSYDDPIIIARFNALLEYVFAQIPDLELTSMAIGNEIDAGLGSNAALWRQYTTFFEATARHARSLRPGLRVGSKAMFQGAVGGASEYLLALNQHSDLVMVTYYPLDYRFQVQHPSQVASDLDELVSLYPGRPIFLAEAGYHSSKPTAVPRRSNPISSASFLPPGMRTPLKSS